MNEETESSIYYSKKMPPDLGSILNQQLAHNYLLLTHMTLQNLNSQAWMRNLSHNSLPNQTQKRPLPRVPSFNETTKRVRLNQEAESLGLPSLCFQSASGFNPKAFSQALGSCREGSEEHTIPNNVSNSSHRVKVITITQAPEINTIKSSESKIQQKNQEKEIAKFELLERFHLPPPEEEERASEDSTNDTLSPPIFDSTQSSSSSDASLGQLDKKELKKLDKFLECMNDYKAKLNITKEAVFEKFKELAILVIPKLMDHFKSKPFEAVAAAILLYACREVVYPITIKEIVSVSDTQARLINKCIVSIKEIVPSPVKQFTPGEFINTIGQKLKISEKTLSAATKIWHNIEKLNLVKSVHAVNLAACCVKFACCLSDDDRDFSEISVAAGMTKMTFSML